VVSRKLGAYSSATWRLKHALGAASITKGGDTLPISDVHLCLDRAWTVLADAQLRTYAADMIALF